MAGPDIYFRVVNSAGNGSKRKRNTGNPVIEGLARRPSGPRCAIGPFWVGTALWTSRPIASSAQKCALAGLLPVSITNDHRELMKKLFAATNKYGHHQRAMACHMRVRSSTISRWLRERDNSAKETLWISVTRSAA
jgi:hypothetical protein